MSTFSFEYNYVLEYKNTASIRLFQSTNICVDVYSPLYVQINSVRTKIFNIVFFYISVLLSQFSFILNP